MDIQIKLLEKQRDKLQQEIEALGKSKAQQVTLLHNDLGTLRAQKAKLIPEIDKMKRELFALTVKRDTAEQSLTSFVGDTVDPKIEQVHQDEVKLKKQEQVLEGVKALLVTKNETLHDREVALDEKEIKLTQRETKLSDQEATIKRQKDEALLAQQEAGRSVAAAKERIADLNKQYQVISDNLERLDKVSAVQITKSREAERMAESAIKKLEAQHKSLEQDRQTLEDKAAELNRKEAWLHDREKTLKRAFEELRMKGN